MLAAFFLNGTRNLTDGVPNDLFNSVFYRLSVEHSLKRLHLLGVGSEYLLSQILELRSGPMHGFLDGARDVAKVHFILEKT